MELPLTVSAVTYVNQRFNPGVAKQSCKGDLGFKKCRYLLSSGMWEEHWGIRRQREKDRKVVGAAEVTASKLRALSAGRKVMLGKGRLWSRIA